MNNFDINTILDDLKKGAVDTAQQLASTFVKEAAQDATEFVEMSLPATARYIQLVLDAKVTSEEFESLMRGLLNVAEMSGLTEAGLAAIEIDKVRNGVIKTVSDIALGAVSKFL